MAFMKVNLADVDSFEPMPEDDYPVEVEKVEVRSNKAKDGLYLNWELVVLDGDYENRRLWYITSLKEAALFRLRDTFIELGTIDDDDEELELEYDDDPEPTPQSGPVLLYPEVEGLECVARVKNEMYDGRERNRVQKLLGDEPPRKSKRKSNPSRDLAQNRKKAAPAKKSRDTGRSSRRDPDDDDDDDDEEEEEAPRRNRTASRNSGRSGQRRRRIR